jgi:hypothetical protein
MAAASGVRPASTGNTAATTTNRQQHDGNNDTDNDKEAKLTTKMASDLPNNLQLMTNQQLKDLLKLRDLPVSRKKADLIARLETYSGRPKPSKKWANLYYFIAELVLWILLILTLRDVEGICGASAGPCGTIAGPCWTMLDFAGPCGTMRDHAGPCGIMLDHLRGTRGMIGRSRMTDRCTIQKSGLLCGNWGATPTITASSR